MKKDLYQELDEELSHYHNLEFHDFERLFEKFEIDFHGTLAIKGPKPGVIIWDGWNYQAYQILCDYMNSRGLAYYPMDNLEFLLSEVDLDLPLAKPGRSYKRIHWLPTVLIKYERGSK